MRINGTVTVFLLPRSASLSNFQGTVIRINSFSTGNRLPQKYLKKLHCEEYKPTNR